MPDVLSAWSPRLSVGLVATLGEAEAAVAGLNRSYTADVPHPLDAFAHVLLRVEATASSRIEEIELSPRRLLTAEADHREGGRPSDRRAVEALANIEAMADAVRLASSGRSLRTDHLLEVHRRLMAASMHPTLGGWVRDVQNWIGGSGYTPVGATFVPPPPEEVPALLEDLMAFVNRTDVPPLVQAGIAHAQFETIHPFGDRNGRVGRALIHTVLRHREVAPVLMPPISAVLARSPNMYFEGLTAWRHVGAADHPGRDLAAEEWLGVFAEGHPLGLSRGTKLLASRIRVGDRPAPPGRSGEKGIIRGSPIRDATGLSDLHRAVSCWANRSFCCRYRVGCQSTRRGRCAKTTDRREGTIPGVRSTRRHPPHQPTRQRTLPTKPSRQRHHQPPGRQQPNPTRPSPRTGYRALIQQPQASQSKDPRGRKDCHTRPTG